MKHIRRPRTAGGVGEDARCFGTFLTRALDAAKRVR
jgi:hypothetical protein